MAISTVSIVFPVCDMIIESMTMQVDAASIKGSTGKRFSWLSRVRVQLGIAFLVACVVPVLIYSTSVLRNPNLINSFIGSSSALVIGYYFLRKLTHFPGIVPLSYVLPTFTATYGLIVAVFFLARLEYSTVYYVVSYFICLLWFHFLYYLLMRRSALRLAVVPYGNAHSICSISSVRGRILSQPSIRGRQFDAVVADLRADIPPEWERFITDTVVNGIPVYHFKQVSEALTGRVAIEQLSENTLGSLVPNFIYYRIKLWLDFLLAVAVLPMALPAIAITAIAIKSTSPGPVFFRQVRMGYRGQPFVIWKFRSMHHDLPDQKPDDEKTADKDNRITPLGHYLRRYRIDELPQIINILAGEMSWIGPRPEAINLSKEYESQLPYYRYRHILRPGISGWAQVNQGHVTENNEVLGKLHYDFYYIKNFSPWLDILIVLRTIKILFTGFGAR